MFRGRNRKSGPGRSGRPSVQKVPLRGLFSNGVWHCNCDPRLPAQKFETKNGGKNHGRWFYTCQLPQPKRCDFFLWADEAQSREAAAVMNNSRSEPSAATAPQTPTKGALYGVAAPRTPQSLNFQAERSLDITTPYTTPSKPPQTPYSASASATSPSTITGDEPYDWPPSDDEELFAVADKVSSSNAMPPPETPRKALKTDLFSTPGSKRKHDDVDIDTAAAAWPKPTTGGNDDIFTTPSTNPRANTLFPLPSPADTPTPTRFRDIPPTPRTQGESDLAASILTALHPFSIPPETRETIKSICAKHALFTKGVLRGRDISRGMVKNKEERITALMGEIEGLKQERETGRAVVRQLKREVDVAKSANVQGLGEG